AMRTAYLGTDAILCGDVDAGIAWRRRHTELKFSLAVCKPSDCTQPRSGFGQRGHGSLRRFYGRVPCVVSDDATRGEDRLLERGRLAGAHSLTGSTTTDGSSGGSAGVLGSPVSGWPGAGAASVSRRVRSFG